MKKLIIMLFITIFITSCWVNIDKQEETNTWTSAETNLSDNNETDMKSYKYEEGDVVAVMKTSNGTINILLETELAPKTTANFIGLSKQGYYENVIFHRIIKWFMIQWWDPDGTGMWGTSIYWEKFDDEFHPDLKNDKYTISMANSGPNTNGSQFFINTANNNSLDNKHSVFGEVVEWFENVDKLEKTKTDSSDRPEKEVKMISVEIKEFKDGSLKDYAFELDSKIKEIEEIKKQEIETKKTKAVEVGDTVSVHYTWTFEDWEKFDSSLDRGEPIVFQVWVGQMIKGFDDGVIGMKIWDKKTLKLAPADAYGEAEVQIPKANLQSFIDAGVKLEAWEILPTEQWEIKIIGADKDSITIENNHPLAWKTLNFDIELVEI
jgi:cyclophilin family peptidyl-prolyl cis-trans isomerase/FKBP-type peptidyl-prolyl cis-trans isomerase 2